MPGYVQLPACEQEPIDTPPFDRWLTLDGEEAVLFYRRPTGYMLRFLDSADFEIDMATRHIICTPAPDMSDEALADLHFNQVLPLLMGSDGELVFHASASATPYGAIGFLGATGRGKSTLAAAFARAGHPFLTDDGLILDRTDGGYFVRPRRPILRLRPDSEAEMTGRAIEDEVDKGDKLKSRVPARPAIPFVKTAVPLTAIYVLGEPSGCSAPAIAHMAPPATLSALMGHSFLLDVEDKPRIEAHFHRLAELAVDCECFSLDYPRHYGELPAVIDAVLEHLRNGGLGQ